MHVVLYISIRFQSYKALFETPSIFKLYHIEYCYMFDPQGTITTESDQSKTA